MSINVPPTKTASDLVTSADWNTYVRDNMEEIAKRSTFSATTTTDVTQNTGLGVDVGALVWDTVLWDADSMLPSARSEIAVPSAGKYVCSCVASSGVGAIKQIKFVVYTNAAIGQNINLNYSTAQSFNQSPRGDLPYYRGSGPVASVTASGTVTCNAGDVIRAVITSTYGATPLTGINARIVVTGTLI